MIVFGLKIAAEYHNHYLTMYQKAATQYTSDIDWKLSKKKKERLENKATEYERTTT